LTAVSVAEDAAASDAALLDERALVEQARTDPDAFAALYRRYVGRVHAFAYRRSGSRDVAEDVTAATFERALRGIGAFEWRGGGFGSWLFRIAANQLADHHRCGSRDAKAYEAVGAMAAGGGGDTIGAPTAKGVAALRRALSELRPRYQEAISLRYLAGLSHEEAAAALGVSKPVMAVTLHRALAALRKAMEREQS
jgi:RNA polymerase sigma factor (sigma-70 family)